MPTYPRYGRPPPPKRRIAHPQIQENFTRETANRLEGFLLRETGSVQQRSIRATPQQFFLPGAPFGGDEQVAAIPQNILPSDTSRG